MNDVTDGSNSAGTGSDPSPELSTDLGLRRLAQSPPDLWSRLLAGEITEVFVFGGALAAKLPQTLGLEPIMSGAFRYRPDGTLRSRPDLASAARDLAAGERWIAAGNQPEWAREFMDRAGAIVFYDGIWDRSARYGMTRGARSGGGALLFAAWYLLARARTPRPRPGVYQTLPEPPWGVPDRPETVLEKLASERFHSKLVHVTSDRQCRRLREVRVSAPR